MKVSINTMPPHTTKKTCLIIGVFAKRIFSPTLQTIDNVCANAIEKIIKKTAFEAKVGQILPLFNLNGYDQILLVGLGDDDQPITPSRYRKIIIAAIKALEVYKTPQAVCYLAELNVGERSNAWKVQQITEAVFEGIYRFDIFKTQQETPIALKEVIIHLPDKKELEKGKIGLIKGLVIADAVTFTKNLANLPSNLCTPSFLADQAKELAKCYRTISVDIIEEAMMRKLGMGAILAVSQGSVEEPKLICLEYKGKGKKQPTIALVGKGITFDTGGNSLKQADNMVGMKYDMCGAATVLGVVQAVAQLNLPIHLVGVIAAAENMPGGTAYKPEDILKSLSGQTIEVISTDAEGRLVLSDALTYCERYHPDVVIDIATLTGAVVVALGVHASGLFTNDEPLAKALLKAGEESGDRAWQLPLWDEYQDQIKSPFADMTNSGGRLGGAIMGACFLSRFTKKFRWAHLDVAGSAAVMAGVSERKATGRPVPLLLQYLMDSIQPVDK